VVFIHNLFQYSSGSELTMPHALPVPYTGFQALILCGPGASLSTFTAKPEDFPKALVPIANRPMMWYPLDWCYRMGITTIHLITPPTSSKAIEAALMQNPHLTSLPSPRADILAPESLTQTSGTAEILRLPEVQKIITGDFLVLPCDLVCDVPGEALLEAWMISQGGLGGVTADSEDYTGPHLGTGGEKSGRRGGLGVWFQTKSETSVKGEETDFIMTTALERPIVPPPEGSLRKNIQRLVYSVPTDTLRDITSENESLPIRHGLIRKHGKLSIRNTYRDSHIYLFPHWVLDMINKNDSMDSISEDVVGYWAKAGWQDGLGEKMGLREVFEGPAGADSSSQQSATIEDEIDIESLSTTYTSSKKQRKASVSSGKEMSGGIEAIIATDKPVKDKHSLVVPSMLAYIHPSDDQAALIRRVDTAALLLSTSLRLAKLESIEVVGKQESSPFAHQAKIANRNGVAQRCTVTEADCLISDNVTIQEKSVIKESVVGANCTIKTGARLTRCLLMDGVVVGERCQLTGCVVGRRAQIGAESILKDCEVQEGNMIPEGSDAKGEKFMVFEGLDEEGDFADGDGVADGAADEDIAVT
jgi:translation initiation factor eIF-2B subunit gamma